MPRHWQMLQVQQKFDWHDAVVFYTVWVNRLWFCKLCRQNLFFTLHGWTDCGFSHYVVELTSFWHTMCWNWPCGFCTLRVCGFAKNASWLNCLVLHILVGPNWFFMLYGWIPSSTEQENKRACCMGGFHHWRSRRAREHAVWVDFNTDGAGEPENRPASWQLLGHWCFNTFNNLVLIQISPRCSSSVTQCSPHFATHSPRKRVCICTTAKWVVCCQECR